jgi:hypothetical protein
VSKSSKSQGVARSARIRRRRDAFYRVEAQNQMTHTGHHGDLRLVRFEHATSQIRSTHVGNLTNDEHISAQSFRQLPSKFTVVKLVLVVGGFRAVISSDRRSNRLYPSSTPVSLGRCGNKRSVKSIHDNRVLLSWSSRRLRNAEDKSAVPEGSANLFWLIGCWLCRRRWDRKGAHLSARLSRRGSSRVISATVSNDGIKLFARSSPRIPGCA